MWNGQVRLADSLAFEEHDIQIQRARPPPGRADASGIRFDLLQRSEQILR